MEWIADMNLLAWLWTQLATWDGHKSVHDCQLTWHCDVL